MDNFSKAAWFQRPDHIPLIFYINAFCWEHYPKEALWELMETHPMLFPGYKRPAADWKPRFSRVARKDQPYTDPMGCTWETTVNGVVGTVHKHPLEDWSAFGTTWHIPDPNTTDGLYPVDWAARKREWAELRAKGGSFRGELRHGHTFLHFAI